MPAASATTLAAARELGGRLLGWYERHGRDLPWRAEHDPYRVLLSEAMLQQTPVARVLSYYGAFLERFPDERALAAASVADVLRAWSGLGYNRRALALAAAAAAVVRDGWPRDADGLRRLPGVGPYTAAAVAAFAFDAQVAAIDVNARRVIERHDGRRRRPAELAARAAQLIPPGQAARFNHALMDLGATVCTARAPRCGTCPLEGCRSRGALRAEGRSKSRHGRQPFVETDRYVRGRVVAALAAGRGLPSGFAPDRLERALAGLERDGLVVRDGGVARLPV